ncbi:MAG: tRNA (adenosine(37)-N6)-dimethylallyltransferase MiaA [Alphaproteobacteria bacterium]|nr:tRNA (adenosine(37)-N6)-dimethylallyltransferase MiaA [Alphaproteobacteria bacterium]
MAGGEKRTVLVIGGPTASGKSGLALSIAKKKDGVVINADSIQLYDGLGTLTAQPSPGDLDAAPHRLYACLQPHESCSAAQWREMALKEIENVLEEGRLPIVAGGTGFYIKVLLEGMSPVPDVPPEVRERMIARQKELGNPGFHAELAEKDPETAARLDPLNTQRVVRAREVLEATGKGLAHWHALPRESPPSHLRFIAVALLPPRETLYARCDMRFSKMLEAGALDEVRAFSEGIENGHIPADTPLVKALGYAELSAHLKGEMTLEEAAEKSRAITRHYAKRQVTWFRHQITPDAVLETPDAAPLLKLL